MRRIPPALLLLFAASPALAAEDDAKTAGTHIDMPFLMAPMNGADGKLAGYAYISSKVTASSDATANDVRDQIAFIQDAFVRDVNGAPIGKPDDPAGVNMPGLQARLLADVRKIMGAKVVALAVVEVQIAPLHPHQSPGAPPPPDSAPPAAASPPPAKTPQKP